MHSTLKEIDHRVNLTKHNNINADNTTTFSYKSENEAKIYGFDLPFTCVPTTTICGNCTASVPTVLNTS
jgi:hypothetical protein